MPGTCPNVPISRSASNATSPRFTTPAARPLAGARHASKATTPAPQPLCIPCPNSLLPTTPLPLETAPEKARRAAHRCAKAPITARARGGYGPRPAGVADAANASPTPPPRRVAVPAHVNCSRWRLCAVASAVSAAAEVRYAPAPPSPKPPTPPSPPRPSSRLQSRRPRWLSSQSCGG